MSRILHWTCGAPHHPQEWLCIRNYHSYISQTGWQHWATGTNDVSETTIHTSSSAKQENCKQRVSMSVAGCGGAGGRGQGKAAETALQSWVPLAEPTAINSDTLTERKDLYTTPRIPALDKIICEYFLVNSSWGLKLHLFRCATEKQFTAVDFCSCW